MFNYLSFAILLAFVDNRFTDWLAQVDGGRHQCQGLCCRCTETSPSSLHISSPRPVVCFLPRGPDETGCEDRWGILSQSQVPDPTGVHVLSEMLRHTSWLNLQLPHRLSCFVSMCLALDLLCWDADWFPQGVCDLAQRSDRQLLRGVWAQVCIMQRWLIATWAVTPWLCNV